jgi:single-strand DNA-binding protein
MLNKVMLIGNLGGDPEVRHLESGAVVAKFSLATNERYKDKAGELQSITEWHDIIMWRGLAELAERILTKGKMIYVEGKLTTRKWQDQQGQNRRTTEVVASNFYILEKKDSSGQGSNNFPNAMNEPVNTKPLSSGGSPIPNNPLTTNTPNTAEPSSKPTTEIPEDDLPF